jgi:hypothetical protein
MLRLEAVVGARGCKRKCRDNVPRAHINNAFKNKTLSYDDVKRWLDLPSPQTNRQTVISTLVDAIDGRGENIMTDVDYNELMVALRYKEDPPSPGDIEADVRSEINKSVRDYNIRSNPQVNGADTAAFADKFVTENLTFHVNRSWGNFMRREELDAVLAKLRGYTAMFELYGDIIRVNIHERRSITAYRATQTNSKNPNDTRTHRLKFNNCGIANIATPGMHAKLEYNKFAVTRKMQMYNQVVAMCAGPMGTNVAKIVADYWDEPVCVNVTQRSMHSQMYMYMDIRHAKVAPCCSK